MSISVIFKPIAGASLLRKKRHELQLQQKNYRNGNFIGHPEEQLELIENVQNVVREVKAAQARRWEPSSETVSRSLTARNSWIARREVVCSEIGSSHYEHVLTRLEERAHWATLGLI